ncbi:uncharacterized protein LOC128755014 [Synchiropus splendidus]|uniref:uncharacterized protein LOC128755014 n=1 Tax=Synchiropus splendidus TaxID=270530 RepID=UPI00237DB7A9|nr:uncharacterized protein LOC128755014 [Synchiropus splendidus]
MGNQTMAPPEKQILTDWCLRIIPTPIKFKPLSRADVWLWCGGDRLYDRLPNNASGMCAPITLLLPTTVIPVGEEDILTNTDLQKVVLGSAERRKRSAQHKPVWLRENDETYIDAIGIPRGVPDKYKMADQIKTGFESIFIWVTPNKNLDRINYVHYNIQRLGNWTVEGFEAVHEQLKATSMMAFQNRVALDMLLAEKGGVCAHFQGWCCTLIPNNTAPGGRLTRAIDGLRALTKKMKEHSGVDTSVWTSWLDKFGSWKGVVQSIVTTIGIFLCVVIVIACCCIPCFKTILTKLVSVMIDQAGGRRGQYALVPLDPEPDPPGDDVALEEGL